MQIPTWLKETTAWNVMRSEITVLRPEAPMSDAANVFLQQQISGAPVADADNRCVGVLRVE